MTVVVAAATLRFYWSVIKASMNGAAARDLSERPAVPPLAAAVLLLEPH